MQHSVHFASADYNEEMKTMGKLTLTLHKTKDTKNKVDSFVKTPRQAGARQG